VILSIVCEAFGCLPSQAAKEEWSVVRDILEYRLINSAKDQHNRDASQMTPDQINIWREMAEAVEDDNG
jgi:hypothetical protein